MSHIDKLNLSVPDWLSSPGTGKAAISKEDVIMAIPRCAYGQLFLSLYMQSKPHLKDVMGVKRDCRIFYRSKSETGRLPKTDAYTVERIFREALQSVLIDKKLSYRKLADKLCETENNTYRKFYKIYNEFYGVIDEKYQSMLSLTKLNLFKSQ